MTTSGHDGETPRETLARQAAEGYAELIELADAPDTPDHMRGQLRAIADAIADDSADAIRKDIALTEEEKRLRRTQDEN